MHRFPNYKPSRLDSVAMGPQVPRISLLEAVRSHSITGHLSYWLTVFTLVSHNNLRNPFANLGIPKTPRAQSF